MLEVSVTEVNFGELAVNDIPSYRQIKLRNTESTEVSVQLSSSSPCVRFQSENENAGINRNDMDDRMSYNRLFDTVNRIDAVSLGPGEEIEFVAWFKADRGAFGHLLPQSSPAPVTGTIQLISSTAPKTGFSRATSSVDLAVSLSVPASQASPAISANSPNSGTPGTVRSSSVSLAFYAAVYLSQLQVSPNELQTTMTPNKTQCLDVTVSNVSCRPLSFVVRNQTMPVKGVDLALYEAERFEEPKLGHRILLDSHAFINLSIMLRTDASSFSMQQFQTVLQCDNLRDEDNTVLINVNVNIVAESQGDIISVSETTLNFGEVYRGTKAMMDLGFMNVDGRENVVVMLTPGYKRKINADITLIKEDSNVSEVSLGPQKGMQNVKIAFKANLSEDAPDTEKVKFDLDFAATSSMSGRQQRIVVRCTANLFTSTIVVPQRNVNFGDCQVGQGKRLTLSIENQSPLPGSVLIQIRSKIITIEGASSRQNMTGSREICEEFSIGPSSKLSITLKITPQRVNPTYRKQLTVVNLANSSEDKQIINIEANNMAPPEAKLHNELYTWDCRLPGTENNAAALCAISNVPLLVPYLVQSKSDECILLDIKSTCTEIDVFYCTDSEKTKELEAVAAEWRSCCVYGNDTDISDVVSTPAERVEELRRSLVELLLENAIIATEVRLEPRACISLFAIIIRTASTSDALTKEDGLLISVESIEAPRFVRLSYRLCGTLFDLTGQKTKNFGEVNIGIKKTTKLPIVNRCKSALFVKVEKSRSVTAGHLRIENSDRQCIFIVVRPFATKEVELAFYPGIKGNFDEKVHLTNVMYPQNSYALTLKATVVKADTFDVNPDSWNFGSLALPPPDDAGQLTRVGAKFMVTNTSKTRRQIRVKLDMASVSSSTHGPGSAILGDPSSQTADAVASFFGLTGVDLRIQLDMELSGAGMGSTRKIEEQIEKLEQKLKIHERKKKFEKMEIVKKRIESLKRELGGEEVDLAASATLADHDYSESEDESTVHNDRFSQATEMMAQLMRDGVALPTMGVGESVAITLGLTCSRIPDQAIPEVQATTLNLLLYEARDQEVNRIFPIDVTLVRPDGESDMPAAPQGLVTSTRSAGHGTSLSSLISLEPGVGGVFVSSFMGIPLIVLKNTIVNDHTELTLIVKASSDTTVVVLEPRRCGGLSSETPDARFKFFPRNGIVRADEALRIVTECTPRSVGPQKYFVPVKNLQNAADVKYFVVELNPTEEEERVTAEPKELFFRDLVLPCDPKCLEPQLLLVRSRYQFPHALLIRTNKPAQLLLFEDAQCTIPLQCPIQRTFMRETVRVYAKYVPSPKTTQHAARSIRAGILIEAIVANNEVRYCTVGRAVVSATIRVGNGEILCDATNIDLGSCPMSQRMRRTPVSIRNLSDTFSVTMQVSALSANVSVTESDKMVTLSPLEQRDVVVELLLPSPGLYQEQLVFHNLTCRQDPITVSISVLRRDDAVALVGETPSTTYDLPIVAVERSEDGSFHLHSPVSTAVTVRNASAKALVLTSRCPLPLMLSRDDDNASLGTLRSAAHLPNTEGGYARLGPRSNAKLSWTLPCIPSVDINVTNSLLAHNLVTLDAPVKVVVAQAVGDTGVTYNTFRAKQQAPTVGQCVLVLPFIVRMALSEGWAEPTNVDLGAVGHAGGNYSRSNDDLGSLGRGNGDGSTGTTRGRGFTAEKGGWRHNQTPAVTVKLVNKSSFLPLRLKVECPPVIRFANTRITVPPGRQTEIEASLQLSLISAQGPFRYEAFFVNELNQENEIALTLTGQYYWKIFRLSTEATDEVKESLMLPALHVDGTAVPPVVLSEEKLVVTATESNVELCLSVQNNPKLEGIVQLQVLHYDATSGVETLTFKSETVDFGATGVKGAAGGGGTGGGGTAGMDAGGGIMTTSAADGSTGGGAVAGSNGVNGNTDAVGKTGATPQTSTVNRRKQQSQTIRVRCVLLKSDLGSLASLFSEYRKKKDSADTLTFDALTDLEKRSSGSAFKNMWLGTVTFANSLTDDEDITVYGELNPFATFSAPSRLSLTPSRMVCDFPTPGASQNYLVYVGELNVTNVCEAYTVSLTLSALISDQLGVALTVVISGGDDDEGTQREGSTGTVRENDATEDNSFTDTSATQNQQAATPKTGNLVPRTTFTNAERRTPASVSLANSSSPSPMTAPGDGGASFSKDAAAAATPSRQSHRLRIAPKATATLHVIIRSNDPLDLKHLQQSSLEQLVALVIADENVPSSISVLRLGVTPWEGDLDEAPLYVEPGYAGEVPSTSDVLAQTDGPNSVIAPSRTDSALATAQQAPPSQQAGVGGEPSSIPVTSNTDDVAMESSRATDGGANADGVGTGGVLDDSAKSLGATLRSISSAPPLSPSSAVTRQVISLKGCLALPDCPGSYSSTYSIVRGESPAGGISIRNNLMNRSVEYTVSVTSQSPLSWVYLPSSSGVLEAGETQSLRLNLTATEVGSFVCYVAIRNNANTFEVVYLRLSAEVFETTAGDRLFEVVTSNGFSVASNEVRNVSIGHLYGSGISQAYIALELVNRSSVPLEFPVSVVKPFRLDVKPARNAISLDGLLHRHHHHHSPGCSSDGAAAHEAVARRSSSTSDLTLRGQGHTTAATAESKEKDADGGLLLPAVPLSQTYSVDTPAFEGKLIACHIHGVPTQTSMKYIVVDPKSRVRLAFVLTCTGLHVPEGYGVFGEADVVFKCKQARDANFTFRAHFEAYQPTFRVAREFDLLPHQEFAKVEVFNLLSTSQTFFFRSQSPVLSAVEGTGSTVGDMAALQAVSNGGGHSKAAPCAAAAELRVRGRSSGYFAVRLDSLRAAALLNFDKDDAESRPSLCEHGFILNAHNPRERVRLELRQQLNNVSNEKGKATPTPPICAGTDIATSKMWGSGIITVTTARPVKAGGQHINEAIVMRFAQQFTSTLALYGEQLQDAFAHYGAKRDAVGGPGSTEATSEESFSSHQSDTSSSESFSTETRMDELPTASATPAVTKPAGEDSGLNQPAGNATSFSEVSTLPQAGGTSSTVATPAPAAKPSNAMTQTGASGADATRSKLYLGLPPAAWKCLRNLLLDLTWLVDELVFYSILLRNSRLIQGYCVFVTSAVCNHPVMKVWRQYKSDLPPEFGIFAEFLEMLDYLPCPTPT